MKKRLTGYQWGDDGAYIGPYAFDNNLDKEDVHLPPRTTLTPPPDQLAVDEEAAWDGKLWVVRRLSMSHLPNREVA
ncbi:hypothetical protein [Undibacterium rugosum]|uniref:hypothetical protein n=1 Tax=Undibacterium rugosum TaxID=2762291 RepID=UPI001B81F8CF|nr:hypothetical protein [Undibacterium rugosum]MBR7777375.1 hypothetical protein [Undibacterium rugosum]